MASTLRRSVGILSSLLLATVTVAGLSSPAQAEDGYTYWNYFHEKNGAWEFSQKGPAQYKPADGALEGFRYGTSTVSQGIEPRADLAEVDFDTVCADEDAAAGEKRVAVVLDYGTEADAAEGDVPPQPRAECAVVAEGATTQQVLGEVTDVRQDQGMTCGIDGYPTQGCGTPVKNAQVPTDEQTVAFDLPGQVSASGGEATDQAAADQSAADEGTPAWLYAVVAVVVVGLGVGGVALSRRRRV
jgi:hypothetical protein